MAQITVLTGGHITIQTEEVEETFNKLVKDNFVAVNMKTNELMKEYTEVEEILMLKPIAGG